MRSQRVIDSRLRRGLLASGALASGFAIDLGSARTRAWAPGQGLILDVPTTVGSSVPDGRHPVCRGRIVDVAGAARLLLGLLGDQVAGRRRLTVVATTPVLSDEQHRDALRTVLDVLGPETVVTIDGVKAAALGAGADVTEPLLVVDIGAQLTEVALLTDGVVVEARRTPLGVDDLGSSLSAAGIVEEIGAAALHILRGDYGPHLVDALDRGVLLAGGGALRPEITYKLTQHLGTPVHPAPAPHSAAARGAGTALQATSRHPGTH